MRLPGPCRQAVLAAMRELRRRADYEEVARSAAVPADKARQLLKDLRRAEQVHVAALEVRPGSPRARALYALGPAANDGGAAVLDRAMRVMA